MSEKQRRYTKDGVRSIIQSKDWYVFNQVSGGFNWSLSVQNIAHQLLTDPIKVRTAIETAFTPNCLSQIEMREDGETIKKTSLLKTLKDEHIDTYIWTVGDEQWQKTKFEKSGADRFIPTDHYYSSPHNKHETLNGMMRLLGNENDFFIVVDDKQSNIDFIDHLANEYKTYGIEIESYHMRLDDPKANATSFHHWLMEQIKGHPGKTLRLILDFDGVAADTDGVLSGPAVDNILKLL